MGGGGTASQGPVGEVRVRWGGGGTASQGPVGESHFRIEWGHISGNVFCLYMLIMVINVFLETKKVLTIRLVFIAGCCNIQSWTHSINIGISKREVLGKLLNCTKKDSELIERI